MTTSKELQAIIAMMPPDFADPAADFTAVRAMFAPFHGHPVSPDFEVNIREFGGVRCGDYQLAEATPRRTAFHCHGGAFV